MLGQSRSAIELVVCKDHDFNAIAGQQISSRCSLNSQCCKVVWHAVDLILSWDRDDCAISLI